MSVFKLKEGCSHEAVRNYFERTHASGQCIEGIAIWKDGQVMLQAAPAPYSIYDKGEVYSLSKMFCSTAIGFAVAEGKLRLDEKIRDIYPDIETDYTGTVQDLLTMRSGHKACVMPALARSMDPVRAFFRQPLSYEPGTHFAYNTAATYMLSRILQRRTDMTAADYLEPRLFRKLGIEGITWNNCCDANEGGIGLHVSVDDIMRLGILYLQRGVWNGERILPAEWIDDASSPHADNSMNGTPDWCAGYGYQIWRNARCGYRGDGAFGQLCMVMPERNTVVAVRAYVDDMQKEVDDIMQLLDEIEQNSAPTEIPAYSPLEGGTADLDGLYRCKTNVFGWTQLRIEQKGSDLIMTVFDGSGTQKLTFGGGEWKDVVLRAKKYCPKLVDLQDNQYTEEMHFAASYKADANTAVVQCRYRTTPHTEEITITKDGSLLKMHWSGEELRAEGAADLEATRIAD